MGAEECPFAHDAIVVTGFSYPAPSSDRIPIGTARRLTMDVFSNRGTSDEVRTRFRMVNETPGVLEIGTLAAIGSADVGALMRRHTFEFEIRGLAPGAGRFRAESDDPAGATRAVTTDVRVDDRASVVVSPESLAMRPGETASFACEVTLASGSAADPRRILITSRHALVAWYSSLDGLVYAGDPGDTELVCEYDGVAARVADTARVSVRLADPPPPHAALAGAYLVTGTPFVASTCPAVFGPTLLTESFATVSVVGGVPMVTMHVGTPITGEYEPLSGRFEGYGRGMRSHLGSPVAFEERIRGTFTVGPPVRLQGQLTRWYLDPTTRATICAVAYDAVFTGPFASLRATGGDR